MHWLNSMINRVNNRTTMMSLLALGVGATALGISRRRRMNGMWRQMMQPLRKMF